MTNEPLTSSTYSIPSYMVEGVERARRHIVSSGARWSAAERADIARVARAAKAGGDRPTSDLPEHVAKMSEMLAANAHVIDQSAVDAFVSQVGRGAEAYVEMIGVVARIVAIDTFATGIDATLVDLTAVDDQPPSGITREAARKRSAFVPTVGPAGATTALSSIQSEDDAQEDLHGSLYLSYREMGDLFIEKGLPRWQLELIASRTSLINECFF